MTHDLAHLEETLWILTAPVGLAVYDFPFETFFAVRRPFRRPARLEAVARIGAFQDYEREHAALAADGVALVHTPEQHLRATQLPRWYPLIEDLTPRSLWFEGPPDVSLVGRELGWPIFMKGIRQTNRHQRALSIIEGPAEMRAALEVYAQDTVLKWQQVVCRKLEPLRRVEDPKPERIPSSFEFRSFWWRGELVGFGRYWFEGRDYVATPEEERAATDLAREAARRIDVPFLVIDVAQRTDGSWLVIECNDGQESGYAGIVPFTLWQRVLALESRRGAG